MAKQKPASVKRPEQKHFRVSGQFVRRTFIAAAKQAGYSDHEAEQLFSAMLRDGRIIDGGQIGILQHTKKYMFDIDRN